MKTEAAHKTPEEILWFFHALLLCLILPCVTDTIAARLPLREFLLPAVCGFLMLFYACGLIAGSSRPSVDPDAAQGRRFLCHQFFFFSVLTCFQVQRFSAAPSAAALTATLGAALFWSSGALLRRFCADRTEKPPVNMLAAGGAAGALIFGLADPARPGVMLSVLPLIAAGVMFLKLKNRRGGIWVFAAGFLTLLALPALLTLLPGRWQWVPVEPYGAPYRVRAENGMLLVSSNGIDADSRPIEGLASQQNVPVLLSVLLQSPKDAPLNVAVYSIGESPLVRQLAQLPLIREIHAFSPRECAALHEKLRFSHSKNPVVRHDNIAPDALGKWLKKQRIDVVFLDFPWPDSISRGYFFSSAFGQKWMDALPGGCVAAIRFPHAPADPPELARACEGSVVRAFPLSGSIRLDGPYDSFLIGLTGAQEPDREAAARTSDQKLESGRLTEDFDVLEDRLVKRAEKFANTPGFLSAIMPYWRRETVRDAAVPAPASNAKELFLTRAAETDGFGRGLPLRFLSRHSFSMRILLILGCMLAAGYFLLRYLLPSWAPSAKSRFGALEQGLIAGLVPGMVYFSLLENGGGKDALVHFAFTLFLLFAAFFMTCFRRRKIRVWTWLLILLPLGICLLSVCGEWPPARIFNLLLLAFLLRDFVNRPDAEGGILPTGYFLTGAGAAAILIAGHALLSISSGCLILFFALLLVLQCPKKNSA